MTDGPDVLTIADNLYTFPVPNPHGRSGQATNVYVFGPEPVTLIDAGSDDGGRTVLAALNQLGINSVATILLTHAHHDHAGSAAAVRSVTGAQILVTESDLPGAGFEIVPDVFLLPGERFDAGRYHLEAIPTPGHAPGHISFYEPDLKCLFAGDLMSGFGTVAVTYPRGSMGDYLESLRRVQKLEVATVYPGHGPAIMNGAGRIVEYIDHREWREIEILALIQQGVGRVEDITEQLYPDVLPRFRPLAAGTVLAHIVHLMSQSKVRVSREATELAGAEFAAIAASQN